MIMDPAGQDDTKPCIIYCTIPGTGHAEPAFQIGAHLAKVGYDVTMLSARDLQPRIEALGMRFHPLHGMAGLIRSPHSKQILAELLKPIGMGIFQYPDPVNQVFFAESLWGMAMSTQFSSLRDAMGAVRRRVGPGREVIVLADCFFSGLIPFRLGAYEALPEGYDEMPKSIGINVIPMIYTSEDHGPYGSLGLPDTSETARHLTRVLAKFIKYGWDPLMHQRQVDMANRAVLTCGAVQSLDEIWARYVPPGAPDQQNVTASLVAHDVVLQMCIPSLEYKGHDWPEHFRFGGTLPIKPLPQDLAFPPWWDEVLANSKKRTGSNEEGGTERKRIVMVAQGTVEREYNKLLVPTIRGLASRDDLLVVALLCVRDATLDEFFASPKNESDGDAAAAEGQEEKEPLPPNVRVIDFFPYDAVLEHADVFVSNSGYGGFQHAVANAVPLVQAGLAIDKPEIGRRAVYTGFGFQILSPQPQPEEVATAVETVLSDPKYSARAAELQKEAEEFDALGTIVREVEALSKRQATTA